MNYLDFSHKIMLYLQLKGILFRCDVLSETAFTEEISSKNGIPYRLSIAGATGEKLTAINAEGLALEIEDISANTAADIKAARSNAVFANLEINASGDVDIQFVKATGQIGEIEDVEAITGTIIKSVLSQVLAANVEVKSDSAMSVSFASFNTLSTQFSAETATAVSAVVKDCDGLISKFQATGETSAELVSAIVATALIRFAVGSASGDEISSVNAAGFNAEIDTGAVSAVSAVIKLLVDAVIGHYEGWSIGQMGSRTIGELSKILI